MPKNYAPLLYITDGQYANGKLRKLDLLDRLTGFMLDRWTQAIPQQKGGGYYIDNPLADGRTLVLARYDNTVETLQLKLRASSQDEAIRYMNDLLRWLDAIASYWQNKFYDTAVYLAARSGFEEHVRYATLFNGSLVETFDAYDTPFAPVTGKPVARDLVIRLERGPWLAQPPGISECAPVSSLQAWSFSQWTASTGTPPGYVNAMLKAPNGHLLAGISGYADIWRSTDNGATWAQAQRLSAQLASSCNALTQDNAGNLYAACTGTDCAGIWKSTNNGAAWTRIYTADLYDIAYMPSTNLLCAVGYNPNPPYFTGLTVMGYAPNFTDVRTHSHYGSAQYLSAVDDTPNNHWLIGAMRNPGFTMRGIAYPQSPGVAEEWATAYPEALDAGVSDILTLAHWPTSNYALCASNSGSVGTIWNTSMQWDRPGEESGGYTYWFKLYTLGTKIYCLAEGPDGTVYAGGDGLVYFSKDAGHTWGLLTTAPTGQVRSILPTATNIVIGEEAKWWTIVGMAPGSSIKTDVVLGQEAICEPNVFVANMHAGHNVTDLKIFDTPSTWSSIFPMTLPRSLLPAAPAVGDIFYIGCNMMLADKPTAMFGAIVFNLDKTQVAQDITIAWEYWNGAWTALTCRDDTNGLKASGVCSLSWDNIGNTPLWASTTVDGMTGRWIRARVTAVGANPKPPIQVERSIYFVEQPYVEMAEEVVGGTLQALGFASYRNVSVSTLPVDRLLVGLRGVARGPAFSAYINLSLYQIPAGVSFTLGSYAAHQTTIDSPTSAYVRFMSVSSGDYNKWLSVVKVNLATALSRDYYGTYRAFVRVRRVSASGNMRVRIATRMGSGGAPQYSRGAKVTSTEYFNVIDLGKLTISNAAVSSLTQLNDATVLELQAYVDTNTELAFYDLILMPTDEWGGDFVNPMVQIDPAAHATAEVSTGEALALDSISYPKHMLVASVRQDPAELTIARYESISNGPMVLMQQKQQRLWFLAMNYDATNSVWVARPCTFGRVHVRRADRYLSMRGAE